LHDWLPEGHLARFVAEVVEVLDLAAIYAKYEAGDGRGLSAYDPRMRVRVLIYGYCRGVASSRRAPDRQKHGEKRPTTSGPPPPDASVAEQMRHKLRTAEGQAVYKLRKAVVEPVFGQIKEARGFRRFLLRGLAKVQAEWQMIYATHNLLKLFRT
jgi:hypothetical protein